jgi:hypothetical protein
MFYINKMYAKLVFEVFMCIFSGLNSMAGVTLMVAECILSLQ